MNTSALWAVVAISLATAAVSMTLTKAVLFKRPRDWIAAKSEMLGELVNCPYCTSHWIAIAFVAYYQPRLVESRLLVADLILSIFFVVTLTSVFAWTIFRSYYAMMGVTEDDQS